jgi:flagellar hook assembly protein FlgD
VSRLHPSYPNPFNPRTTIKFELNRSGPVDLAVFDVAGRLVKRLVSQPLPAGHHDAVWEGRDSAGRAAAAGVYFFRLKTNDTVDTKRMTLIK